MRDVPDDIRELLRAEALGISLAELRATPWEDVEARLAWIRGRQSPVISRKLEADD